MLGWEPQVSFAELVAMMVDADLERSRRELRDASAPNSFAAIERESLHHRHHRLRGRHLAEHLLAAGDAVLGCSQAGRWGTSSPRRLAERVNLLAWTLPDVPPVATRTAIEHFSPDVIYHLAGLSVPQACGESEPTAEAWAVNVEGTRRVLDVAAALPVRPRVLLVSSVHVYAPVSAAEPLVDESAPLAPRRGYGKTKLAMEELGLSLAAERGLPVVIARAFNHTGPGQLPPLLVPQWCQGLAQGQRPLVVQNLSTRLDLSDVRDVVRAYRLLAERGQRGEAYNVGRGVAHSTGHILKLLLANVDPAWPLLELQPGERHSPLADVSKLQALANWRCEFPLEKTLADAWSWCRQRAANDID